MRPEECRDRTVTMMNSNRQSLLRYRPPTESTRIGSYLAALVRPSAACVDAAAIPLEPLRDFHADELDDSAWYSLNGIPPGLLCRNVEADLSIIGAAWYVGPGADTAWYSLNGIPFGLV